MRYYVIELDDGEFGVRCDLTFEGEERRFETESDAQDAARDLNYDEGDR